MNYRLLIAISFILLALSLASASASDVDQTALHDSSLDAHIDSSLHDTAIADSLVSDSSSDDSKDMDKIVPDSSIDDGASSADAVDDGSADIDDKDIPADDGSADEKVIPVDDKVIPDRGDSGDDKVIPSHDDSNVPIDSDITDDDSIISNITNDAVKPKYNDEPISNIKESSGSFDDLQSLIDLMPAGGNLILYRDYKGAEDKQVTINKDICIYGEGHTIDCAGVCRALYSNSGNVVLKNLRIINGHYDTFACDDRTNNGGAIWIGGTATYTLIDCSLIDNWADDSGGAIYNDANNHLSIINCVFKSNTCDDVSGGAIFSNGPIYVYDSLFDGNTAYKCGGAIYSKGFAYINQSRFDYNKCGGALSQCQGGAIYCKEDVNVENSTFKSNSADDYGGAIYAHNVKINQYSSLGKSHFINNKALDNDGGAIYSSSHCNVNNAEFDSNTAEANGGAIYSYHAYIENSTFKKNHAEDSGGAIWFGDLLDAYNSEFISNKALIDGGAIFGFTASTIYMGHCTFDSNRAEGSKLHKCYGGAIRATELCVQGSKFIKNYSENHGGAIFAERASDIVECTFDGNSAKEDGGAVYVNLGELFIIRLSGCLCINNKAGDEGGVLYADSVDARVKLLHNVFANNSAKDGRVAFNKGTYAEICNNWWCGANPTKNDNVLVEWKFWTSNVNHVDSDPLDMVLGFDKNFVKAGQIVRATIYLVKSNGDLFKGFIPMDFSFSLPDSIKEVSSGFDQNSAYIDLIAEKSGMFFIIGNSFDYPGAANILFVFGSDLSKDISNTNSGIVKNANSINSQFDDGCLIDNSIFNPAKTMNIPKSKDNFSIYSILLSILAIFGL